MDADFRTKAIDHGARLGIDVHVVQRAPGTKGFKVVPKRWTIELTFGWLLHRSRLARDPGPNTSQRTQCSARAERDEGSAGCRRLLWP